MTAAYTNYLIHNYYKCIDKQRKYLSTAALCSCYVSFFERDNVMLVLVTLFTFATPWKFKRCLLQENTVLMTYSWKNCAVNVATGLRTCINLQMIILECTRSSLWTVRICSIIKRNAKKLVVVMDYHHDPLEKCNRKMAIADPNRVYL